MPRKFMTPEEMASQAVYDLNPDMNESQVSVDPIGWLQGLGSDSSFKSRSEQQKYASDLANYGTDTSNLDKILSGNFYEPKQDLMNIGSPARLPQIDAPSQLPQNAASPGVSRNVATVSDKAINPIVKKALMAKMATPPVETKSPTVDQDALAQQQYESGKVNPWLAFASGIGQTLQGKSPDLSWQDQQNQLVYDKTLGKLALSKASAEKKRQFEEEMKFKNRSLEEQIAARKELAQMTAQSKKDELGIKNVERARERMTPFGEARTSEDAKKIKEAAELKANFDNKLDEMIALREDHGGGATLNREDVNRGKQLSKDLLLAYKDMAKLGVLSVSDMNILNKIIPDDPLAYTFTPGQDSIMSNMRKFKADTEKDFASKLSNRLMNPPPMVEQGATKPVDSRIEKFMQKNGISDRNEAIRILKEHGKL